MDSSWEAMLKQYFLPFSTSSRLPWPFFKVYTLNLSHTFHY
jgi:hypothetical protein